MANDSKSAILESARYLFAKKGYEGTSISHIAKESGAAKSLIYYYFKSKEEILSEILEEGTRDIYETHYSMSESGEELTEEFMMKIMETIAHRLRNRDDIIRIMLQEFMKGTHKENETYKYANNYLKYVESRAERYFPDNDEAKMKFILELILVGGMVFHLYLISEDFISEYYGFEKEKMWKVFKEIYREDYINPLHKRIHRIVD
ncbi:TetR/AcrR family transcriptional regulator [Wukongibacter sp. M2B1]|uniref:TetR/AcrR family transcriptional regulator n=1 Tax=Wukongibacter sp. M2B1 TaxID=3088895 RepID=UPI003D7BAF07